MRNIWRYFLLICCFCFLFATSVYSASEGQRNDNYAISGSESDFERELRRIRNPLSDDSGLTFKQELQAIRNRIEYEERRNRTNTTHEEEYNLPRILAIIFVSLFIGVLLSIWSVKKFFTPTKPILKEYGDDEVIDAEFVEK